MKINTVSDLNDNEHFGNLPIEKPIAEMKDIDNSSIDTPDIDNIYTTINLSTKGKLYLPESFEIRSLKTKELRYLSIINNDELLKNLIIVLNNCIKDKNVDLSQAYIDEFMEFMIIYYCTFYSPELTIQYTPGDEEIEELKTTRPKFYDDLISGKWKPELTINLTKIKTYNSLDKLKQVYEYKRKNTQFFFRFPSLKSIIDINDFCKLNKIPDEKSTDYRVLSCLLSYNGTDLSNLSLKEKLQKLDELEYDNWDVINAFNYISNINIGINPNLKFISPVTNKEVVRKVPGFPKMYDVLSSILISELDKHSNFTIS